MSSLFPLSAQCQLRGHELEQVLLLPDRIAFTTGGVSVSSEGVAAPAPPVSSTATVAATVGGLACAFLSAAYTRSTVTNALVRVHVPKNKRAALVEANPFVQLQLAQEEAAMAAAHGGGGGSSHGGERRAGHTEQDGRHASIEYRVGRIVALLQKPSTGKKSVAAATGNAADLPAWTDHEQAQLAEWLVVVHLGECVEPFPLKYISNEPFSEAEHRVYVQTTTKAHDTAAGAPPAGTANSLLTADQAGVVSQTVAELRDVLETVYRATSVRAQDMLEQLGHRAWRVAQATAAGHLALGVKRERDGVHDEDSHSADGTSSLAPGEKRVKRELGEAARRAGEDGASRLGDSAELLASLGGGDASNTVHVEQLLAEKAQAHAQLQSLRHLVAGKDAEVKRQMQRQKQAQQTSESEAEQMRVKLEEEGRARRRERDEAEQALKEEKAARELAQATVERLVKALRLYKSVSSVVAEKLGLPPDTSKPEEILSALKTKSLS